MNNSKTISLFDDTYEHEIACGKSHIEAKHIAIDEYRRYTSRQVQGDTGEMILNEFAKEEKVSVEDEIEVNQIFKIMMIKVVNTNLSNSKVAAVVDKDRRNKLKLVCALFRINDLEQYLDDRHQEIMNNVLGDFHPDNEYEIAVFLGYKIREWVNPANGKVWRDAAIMGSLKSWVSSTSKELGLRSMI